MDDAGATVEGDRLLLRYPAPDDAPALFELARDAAVTRFFSWGPYRQVDEAQRFIESLPERRRSGHALELLVVDRDHGPIGLTGLFELSRRDRRCIVGTWFGRPYWGTGANRESKALVLHLAFDELGMARVGAWTSTANVRSQRALEGLGFTREGVLRAWHRHGDTEHDVVAFSMLRSEWERSPLRELPYASRGRWPRPFSV